MSAWQKPIDGVCPHGLGIRLVDGTFVRDHFDSDFSQGGNGYRYKWIPKSEIWIDEQINPNERPFIVYHECTEAELMRGGMSYDRAHDRAKKLEDSARRPPRDRQSQILLARLHAAAEYLDYRDAGHAQAVRDAVKTIVKLRGK